MVDCIIVQLQEGGCCGCVVLHQRSSVEFHRPSLPIITCKPLPLLFHLIYTSPYSTHPSLEHTCTPTQSVKMVKAGKTSAKAMPQVPLSVPRPRELHLALFCQHTRYSFVAIGTDTTSLQLPFSGETPRSAAK